VCRVQVAVARAAVAVGVEAVAMVAVMAAGCTQLGRGERGGVD
jgi:hypothetical protein